MQSPIHSFISTLEVSLASLFPASEISFDGANLTIYYKRSDASGDFVLLVVDLTCMEEADRGSVAVHARPDHIFEPHWVVEDDERTLVLRDGQRFEGGDWVDGEEFADGHGNGMWILEFPEDEGRIAALVAGLAGIAARHFEREGRVY